MLPSSVNLRSYLPHRLVQKLCTGLILGSLLLLLVSCSGSHSSTVAPPQPGLPDSRANTNRSLSLPLPGFTSLEIPIVAPTEFGSPIPIPILSSQYAIIWDGSFSNSETVAQSRSGQTVTLDPCAISTQGQHTLTATAFYPWDFDLTNPLVSQEVSFTLDPGCITLKIESILFKRFAPLPAKAREQVSQRPYQGNLYTREIL